MNLNDLQWDEIGGYWYTPQNKNITPQDMLAFADRMKKGYIAALNILAKVAGSFVELSSELKDDVDALKEI